MGKKFYAVKKGLSVGIYETWADCQKQIKGFSGAEYKSFLAYNEASDYLDSKSPKQQVPKGALANTDSVAYVDGSYDSLTSNFSCGIVLFHNGVETHFSELFTDKSLAEMNNVAGELKGAELAMQYCLDHHIKSITIFHDYEGISKWCTGEWKAKKDGTKAYKKFYDNVIQKLDIKFVKVKGHSGDKFNALADKLAKNAFNITAPITKTNIEELQNMPKIKSVFIERKIIKDLIIEIGGTHWNEFDSSDLVQNGVPHRCNFTADGKHATLDFYFKNDGSTTIMAVGKNLEISSKIKVLLEERCAYPNNSDNKTYSFKSLSNEWSTNLVSYLSSLTDVKVVHNKVNQNPVHNVYKFTSPIGDTLTLNLYETGTVTIQGKPAYLYGEAISFLSYCESVSVDDIVDTVNNFHNVDVKISDVRNEMSTLLPHSYGNIDDMILKLLSPSISLRKIQMPQEDYSCYAFPALRALEGYIKYLFNLKSVTIKKTFGGIFDNGALTSNISVKIGDTKLQAELERLYNYLATNRHVIFHAQQILIGTTLLEEKQEADEIVNNVLNLIETSYININS